MTIHQMVLRSLARAPLFLPAGATMGRAQGDVENCEQAERIIEKGRPVDADKWAFNRARGCRAGAARAYAAGLARYSSESDLAALEEFMTQVDNWRDASIFNAAISLATNAAATPQARVFAIRHLIVLLRRNELYTYAGLTRKAHTTTAPGLVLWEPVACVAQYTSGRRGALDGAPLPSDYENQIRSTLASIAGSSITPEPVRNAARCLVPRKS